MKITLSSFLLLVLPLGGTAEIVLSDLSHRNPEIIRLRREISDNLPRGEAVAARLRWRKYRLKKKENFFLVMARTMMNHDTLSTVNRLASLWDYREGDVWLIPNMRGVAEAGKKSELARKYRVPESALHEIPGVAGFWFIPGAGLPEEERNFFNLKIFIRPVAGEQTSGYGTRVDPFRHKRMFHQGIDIGCDSGSSVKASATGKVIFTGWNGGYGKAVIMEHQNGYQTLYGHLSKITVRPGQKVAQGEIIALSGETGRATGPHLHFEVRRKGQPVRPDFNRHQKRPAQKKSI